MKPDFALNFTDTSIALLHRTAKGWLKVGETPFDASDLEDALEYMRKTALGLAPGGFTTKLVIPASQILYTEVDISGGDEERTRREISTALEARTPYKADEIAWDWTRGEGRTARVAAVARETLAEAESFALTHKFSPVSFVAIPPADEFGRNEFGGEPWFGATSDAQNFLATGEEVERDDAAIALIDEIRAAKRRARAARQDNEKSATDGADVGARSVDEADPPVSSAPDLPPTAPPEDIPAEVQDDASIAEIVDQPADPQSAQAALPLTSNSFPEEDDSGFDSPVPFGTRRAETAIVEPFSNDNTGPGPRIAITEITPLGNLAASPAPEAANEGPESRAAPASPGGATGPAAQTTPLAAAAKVAAAGGATPLSANPVSTSPAATAPRVGLTAGIAPVAAVPAAAIADPNGADPDEAPFAHVPDNTSFPEADEAPDLPPLPHLARRMAGLAPMGGQPQAPLAQPAPQKPAAPAAASQSWPGDVSLDDPDADLPPPPSPAAMQAYGRSGRVTVAPPLAPPAPATDPVAAPLAAPRPGIISRSNNDTTRTDPAGEAAINAPPRAGTVSASPGAMSSGKVSSRGPGLAGLVTAPSIPGTRKAKPPARQTQTGAVAEGPEAAARSLGQPPFAARDKRGKPRFLGLILTAVLLLCLALIAAWSSLYLSSNRNAAEEESQLATNASTPDVSADDEMLADGIEPDAEPGQAPETTETAQTPATETAPGTVLDSESPAAVALLGTEDEIFLSSADAPPPAFDALSLPGPEASAEAPPGEPMPPPPFGTVYRFDENGLLLPTAAGLPTPGGYMLFEGKPPRVPPARSPVAEAAAAAARAAAAPATAPTAAPNTPAAPEGETPAPGAETANGTAGNPSLAGAAISGTDPESLPPVAGAEGAATPAAAPPQPEAQPNPELADRRPRLRPESTPDEDAALDQPSGTDAEFAGLRPRARPAVVEAASARARADTAAASLATGAEVQLASAAPSDIAGLSSEEAANPSIMTISRRPAAKPKDFSRAVEAAVAAAVRAPEPAPAAAAPAPAPAPKSNSKSAAKPDEQDEIDEPEVASSPAPKIPTRASVAKQATYTKAINLSKVNLIGVYGTQSNRHALVRLANGKYRKVKVGDKIDGGQVKAITQNEVRYQKGGRLIALPMPKG